MKKGVETKQHSVLAGALILRLILTIRKRAHWMNRTKSLLERVSQDQPQLSIV